MGTAKETMAALSKSRDRERRAEALQREMPDYEYTLFPESGLLTPEPLAEEQPEELAIPHPAARPARTPRLLPRSIQSADSVWD